MPVITLTTDFGSHDWFVGTMKGVILSIDPRAQVVDITHDVPAGDLRAGAFALAASYHYFPRSTIHVAVVDPGVGSSRSALAIRTTNYYFVAPDNGLLSLSLAKEKIQAMHRIENSRFFQQPVSQTFHGRDIFAPIAAHISRGVPLREFGRAIKDIERLAWPSPQILSDRVRGEVVYIDRFGNAISNIPSEMIHEHGPDLPTILIGPRRRIPLVHFYQAVPVGKPIALAGSSGFLEVAVNGGSAAKRLGLRIGTRLEVRWA